VPGFQGISSPGTLAPGLAPALFSHLRFLDGTSVRIEITQEETGTGGVCGVVGGESRKESVIEGVDGVETKG
jgi:hypothetical protein